MFSVWCTDKDLLLLDFGFLSSIISTIDESKPQVVVISITQEDNIQSAKRLVDKIKEEFTGRILIIGEATIINDVKWDTKTIEGPTSEAIPELIDTIKL